MEPAMSGTPADRPFRLYPSAEFTDRAAQSPAPMTAKTVASMMTICHRESSMESPSFVFFNYIMTAPSFSGETRGAI